MSWCPICKEEYKNGVTVCPDCNTELVDSLEDIDELFQELFSFENEMMAQKFSDYLEYSQIDSQQKTDDEGKYVVCVRKKDIKKARKHFSAFYSVEASDALSREINEMKESRETTESSEKSSVELKDDLSWDRTETEVNETEVQIETEQFIEDENTMENAMEDTINDIMFASEAYVKKSDKAKDLLSTVITFGIFGIAGIIFVLLNKFGVINLFQGILFYLIALIVFIGFIIVAINSFFYYKKALVEAAQEEELTKTLNDWLMTHITSEFLNSYENQLASLMPDITSEMKYLRFVREVKDIICKQFGEIDDSYLDYVIEEYYNNNLA